MSKLAVLLGFILLGAITVFGQVGAMFTGRVVDPVGAVVPGATVAATKTDTGIVRTTVTNGAGLYTLPALEPGTYDINVQASGFNQSQKKSITLVTDTILTLDFTLTVAGTTQQVEVTSETPLVETTQSGVSGSLQTNEVQDLPILNRNFSGLVSLVPGARPGAPYSATKQAMGAAIFVGGGQGKNIEVNVDGADDRDDVVGGPLQNYTIEGIQEFKLLAHEFGAQYGRSNGAVLQIVSKSGTNQVHGSAFAYGRSDGMTAIDYFTAHSATPSKTPYDREQFGGSIGGPIKKDRLFFFGAVERIQENSIQSEIPTAYTQAVVLANAFPSLGIVPATGIPQPFRDLMYTLKGDYQINARHSMFVRWGQQRNSKDNDIIGTTKADLGITNYDRNRMWSIVAGETWLISNNSVNQFMFHRSTYTDGQAVNGPYPPPTRTLTFPALSVGWGGSQFFYQNKDQFADNFSHQVGKHDLKLGGDFSFYPGPIGIVLNIPSFCGGIAFFDNPSTILGNTNGKYPQGFLTAGIVSSVSVGTCSAAGPQGALADSRIRGERQFAAYIQDDWKMTPRLTWNLGLRYDLDINHYNQPQMANSRVYQVLKAINDPDAVLPSTPSKDFGPRVGFAWDIGGNGRNVLRAGAGIFFDQVTQGNLYQASILMQPTLVLATTLTNTAVGKGQLGTYVFNVSPLPPAPAVGLTQLPINGNTAGAFLPGDITDPYNEQYHVGYARQLSANFVITADYTHVEGIHEFRQNQLNPFENAWDGNDADKHIPFGTRRLEPAMAAISDPNILASIIEIDSANRSTFDEFIVNLERRYSRATFQVSYTLSRGYGWSGGIADTSSAGTGSTIPENLNQPFAQSEWGPSPQDETHRIVASGVFNLPWGIQASPILQFATARPYNLTAGTDCNADGNNNDRAFINPSTGVVTAGCNPPAGDVQVSYDFQRGSNTFDLDARATKFFNLGKESRKIGFFAEFYNITNRANFGGNYNGNAASGAAFRQPSGYIGGLPTSRQVQLGARILF